MSRKEWILIGVPALVIVVMFAFVDPISQWDSYHNFADDRTMLGIPNALNVLSNLPFLFFGAWGAVFLATIMAHRGFNSTIFLYLVFFIGFAMVAIGSGYYHLWPSNDTLVWDRLPMTIAFMALLSAVIADLLSRKIGVRLLPLFLIVGVFSVFYWDYTEQLGRGDLRLYGLVQFLPALLIALMLYLYKRPENFVKYIVWAVVAYALAKVLEAVDAPVYQLLQIVSGHSLKHISAAVAGLFLLLMLYRRYDAIYQQTQDTIPDAAT